MPPSRHALSVEQLAVYVFRHVLKPFPPSRRFLPWPGTPARLSASSRHLAHTLVVKLEHEQGLCQLFVQRVGLVVGVVVAVEDVGHESVQEMAYRASCG